MSLRLTIGTFDGFSAWSSNNEPLVVIASWLNTDIPTEKND